MQAGPDIKVKGSDRRPPPAVEELLGWHLKRAEQAVMARKAELLRPLDLTVAQYCALAFLLGDASKSCTRLARESLVTSQTMTGIVQNLEAKGLVERRPSPDHGRVHLVSLTPSGLELTLRAERVIVAVEDDLLGALSTRNGELLAGLLNRITEAAAQAGAEPGA
jgi:MarR family transcriptional regulator, lower aerobic nicotinate degradation pathway regulator